MKRWESTTIVMFFILSVFILYSDRQQESDINRIMEKMGEIEQLNVIRNNAIFRTMDCLKIDSVFIYGEGESTIYGSAFDFDSVFVFTTEYLSETGGMVR